MRRVSLLILAFGLSLPVAAQKVAIVMSGGAAKGLAHVGMLKALEENEIPIDYVAGTSMGGIVAGCYAAGMSPAQIEDIMLSDDLLRWVNGNLEDGYNYYYNKDDIQPSFVRLNLQLDTTFNINFNTSIANDVALNFAIAEKMAQPSAIARDNFDSLFVPLRVMASEIFTQQEVVLRKGNLGNALRATQTVPFFYTPIRIDGQYLFDGGVYNNFPVDVAESEFHPDVIIGCNVSTKIHNTYPTNEDDKLLSRSMLYLLMDKSNPASMPPGGIYLQPNLEGLSSLDFAKAKAIIDSGYNETIRKMPEIKNRIALRRTCEEVAARRNHFNNRAVPFLIDNVTVSDHNPHQESYINRLFQRKRRPMTFTDVKRGYYSLVSEDYFKSLYPSFSFNDQTNRFNFNLSKRPQNNFLVDFGGVIATRNISNLYLGLNYYTFNRLLTHISANFHTGSFYQSAQAKARIDFAGKARFYLEPEATFNNWNYIEGNDIVVKRSSATVLKRIDRKMGAMLGLPVGRQFRAGFEASYISNNDQYINTDVLVASDTLDELTLTGSRFSLNLSTNSLNRKQYASAGKYFYAGVDWFNLKEELLPGNTSTYSVGVPVTYQRQWIRGTVILEQYFRTGIYSSGYYVHATLSNQPLFSNYMGTLVNAPGFYPLQDSHTLILENFRAFNFVAGGWRNVFALRKKLDFRLEGYVFKAFESIVKGPNQEPQLSREIRQFNFAGTAGMVLHTTVGPVSFSVNYYDDPKVQWGVLLHVGFLLFNNHSLE
ncbi:MAG: patatin-like phospholipase family protein [Cyclobacteriaceae bacterium]|nr:patatin-like phospholipase family protein [Cyclobacteriaceae bacterium]